MNVKTKLKLDEEKITYLIAWPRFILGASLLATITLALIFTSIVAGYSVKLVIRLQQWLRLLTRATLSRAK